jgi:Holliday junction resolvasome RuvABC endonuclease subunit
MKKTNESTFCLGLDVSTKTIGIALFENEGKSGKLKLLHHVTPKIKPQPKHKMQELFEKVKIFEDEFLNKYSDIGITKVIIEEPLLRSNNVNTIATLLRFNGMISRSVYDTLGVVPEYISSYDARKYAFPELLAIRTHDKKGEPYTEKQIAKNKPVLFGAYPWDIDKKEVIWNLVSDSEPQINWLYCKNKTLKKENYDMSDALVCVIGKQRMDKEWD